MRGKGKERQYEVEDEELDEEEEMMEEDEDEGPLGGMLDGAGKFLLAGGLAGAGLSLPPSLLYVADKLLVQSLGQQQRPSID